MNNNQKKALYEFLDKGLLDEAFKIIKEIPVEMVTDLLLRFSFDKESIIAYTLACKLIQEDESFATHYLASIIMTTALCHLPGAYSVGLYHARKAIEYSSEDVTLKYAC